VTNPTATRFDLTTLGEIMMRYSVPVGYRLEDLQQLDTHPGGAEGNVCTALAGLGRRCAWAGGLPDNPLGKMIVRRLRAAGVDTSAIALTSEARLGTYYVEFATPPRPIQVVYDRADSAAANMTSADVDWDCLLSTRIIHLTGITPALSDSCRQLVQDVVERARADGVPISFDVNYRSKLWSAVEAAETLRPLIQGIELFICGRGDAQNLFGLKGEDRQILEALQSLSQARRVVLTLGDSGAIALDEGRLLRQSAIPAQVVDRLGAGDAFAAGLLDGWFDGSLAEGLRRGAALGALALSQHGDMLITDRAEMNAVLAHAEGGIVR
jgi:2-dehydro-3-deoxygluconokinase